MNWYELLGDSEIPKLSNIMAIMAKKHGTCEVSAPRGYQWSTKLHDEDFVAPRDSLQMAWTEWLGNQWSLWGSLNVHDDIGEKCGKSSKGFVKTDDEPYWIWGSHVFELGFRPWASTPSAGTCHHHDQLSVSVVWKVLGSSLARHSIRKISGIWIQNDTKNCSAPSHRN